ncbi:response regulator transcription factor [Sphingosinicella sp. BN140058]|uniref:response regulator transcription factor n=1 Tax=Sphingosinicella sp. BN140058 TaxID=1892855 RepID=UPI001FB08087|nr:helix-turn-helix transcriptional regulator [Sphingosinicella sp. BN140058]
MEAHCATPLLTDRELEVLCHVATGLNMKEIGQALCISPKTAQKHVDHMKMKLRARNKAALVACALADGTIKRDGSGRFLVGTSSDEASGLEVTRTRFAVAA